MKILDFIKLIPQLIDAVEPEQLKDALILIFTADNNKEISSFDRETDRFFIIKTWRVKSIKGWFGKRYVLRMLNIMNAYHKPHLMNDKDKKKMDKEVIKANSSSFSTDKINGTVARSSQWTS